MVPKLVVPRQKRGRYTRGGMADLEDEYIKVQERT